MVGQKIFNDIELQARQYFSEHQNPELVKKYSRYFKDEYVAYGLTDVLMHEIADEIYQKYPLDTIQTAKLGCHVFSFPEYEFGSLAILLLMKHKKNFTFALLPIIKQWFDFGVGNWAHSDTICSKITPLLLEKKLCTLEDFADWKNSTSRWTRRAVPVTMLCLKRTTYPELLLEFINEMMGDGERVVHQGLGWFLRELWKISPLPVEQFLLKYKQTSARLIFQYACEKMTPEQKQRFKKEKLSTN